MMKIQWDLTICSLLHDGTGLGGRKSDLSQDHRSSHARARDTQAQGGADSTRMHTPTPARPQVQVSQTCTSKDRHTCWISERMESSSTRLLRTSLCSCKNHMPSAYIRARVLVTTTSHSRSSSQRIIPLAARTCISSCSFAKESAPLRTCFRKATA